MEFQPEKSLDILIPLYEIYLEKHPVTYLSFLFSIK